MSEFKYDDAFEAALLLAIGELDRSSASMTWLGSGSSSAEAEAPNDGE